jgi:hypothetical protein
MIATSGRRNQSFDFWPERTCMASNNNPNNNNSPNNNDQWLAMHSMPRCKYTCRLHIPNTKHAQNHHCVESLVLHHQARTDSAPRWRRFASRSTAANRTRDRCEVDSGSIAARRGLRLQTLRTTFRQRVVQPPLRIGYHLPSVTSLRSATLLQWRPKYTYCCDTMRRHILPVSGST